ncbi:ATP-dependent exoDNAse (exonuclease V) beta subunit (contains helicase and exonuclease domains) [Bacteroidales bacterium KHT7]|nr:ATP-dependent exoDNAse (exonuclease V) beta subunit (contains helicase and exonuclease domains) [Bacteroidales bacterium KHT7]
MENGLTVYRASAGAGKTFTLAVEYISLLIEDPGAYRSILAVTFTNKATAEMKDRILQQLYGVGHSLASSESYFRKLKEKTGLDDEVIRRNARFALANILHDYSHFRVETIDSFFQSVLKNLARELDLSPNLKVDLGQDEVRDRAVDQLLERLTPTSMELKWIIEFIEKNMDENRNWNITKQLKSFASNIFDEDYIERGAELRRMMAENPKLINEYREALQNMKRAYSKALNECADRFFALAESYGLTVDNFSRKSSGVAGYFQKIKRDCFVDICNSYVQKALEEPATMFAKTEIKKNPGLQSLAENEFGPLLAETETRRIEGEKDYQTALLSEEKLFSLRLLNKVDDYVHQINTDENRFLLSETPNLLRSVVQQDDASFVFEKMGAMLQHIMIDEFQDTSRMQWTNFYNLLMECLAQGKNSLIVGDEKQSIYRWRNGDWRILQNLNREIKYYGVNQRSLSENYRSSGRIVDFNNNLFVALAKLLNADFKEEFGEESEQLAQAYSPENVTQKITKKTDEGFVSLNFLCKTDENSSESRMLADMKSKVEELTAKGVNLSDITILVRKNKYVPTIAKYFAENMPDVPIVSDEAFQLQASVAVGIIVNALQGIAKPDDNLSLAFLAYNYQKHVRKNEMPFEAFCRHGVVDMQYLPKDYADGRDTLAMMPLYELVENLYQVFELEKIDEQEGYILSFLDKVRDYLQDSSSDITLFLEYWNEKLCTSAVPSGKINGIRIMSIHKSKGLQFHTVLIPYCEWEMITSGTRAKLLWCSTDDEPFGRLPLVPVSYSKSMKNSSYTESYKQETLLEYVDALNELYVAFTRPKCNLIVWGNREAKGENVASLLIRHLNPEASEEKKEKEDVFFTIGSIVLSPAEKQGGEEDENPLSPQPSEVGLKMEIFRNPIDFRQSNKSVEFVNDIDEESAKQDEYIREGSLLHYIMENIETADDVSALLAQMQTEGIIASDKERNRMESVIGKVMQNPDVQGWFDGSWTLYKECTILTKDADGLARQNRPDRVMMKDDEVVVVDFKFASQKHQNEHEEQVRLYRSLLERMGKKNVKCYLWYGYTNKVVKVD